VGFFVFAPPSMQGKRMIGHLWAIAALAAMSSSAVAKTPTNKAQTDCVVAAHLKYSETSIALYQRQGMAPTIDDVIAKRRLMEAYCIQYVRCVNAPELMLGIEFSGCLDDEDADRLKR